MKRFISLFLTSAVLMATPIKAQTPQQPAPQPAPAVRWFPIYARFAPDASWAVVNLCRYYNPLYCRLVRWEPNGTSNTLEDGTPATGHWTLITGQEPDKSYIWPSVSWSGTKLAYVVAQCPPKAPSPTDKNNTLHPLEKLDCAFYNGQPAVSESTTGLRVAQTLAPLYSAARPAWRPDDQALVYWRTIARVTLASGRNIGVRDVYEYDFQTQKETPKFDREATRIMWTNEASGPFYAPDGKTIELCGRWDGMARPDQFPLEQTMFVCVQTDAANPRLYRAMTRHDRPEYFTVAFADWRGTHWLTHQNYDYELVLRDKVTAALSSPILLREKDPRIGSNFSPTDAHISEAGNVITVNSTLRFSLTPIRRPEYFYRAVRSAPPAPLLTYYLAQTKTLISVLWPNVDQLH